MVLAAGKVVHQDQSLAMIYESELAKKVGFFFFCSGMVKPCFRTVLLGAPGSRRKYCAWALSESPLVSLHVVSI